MSSSTPIHVHREMPKCTANIQIVVKDSGQVIRYNYDGEVPRELMDAYERIVGNGLAKVSVSADMGIKDFGSGASSMCSVTLTCNQDEKTIEEAARLAGELARGYSQENRQRAETELQAIIDERKRQQQGSQFR